jgi:hypothetical protein
MEVIENKQLTKFEAIYEGEMDAEKIQSVLLTLPDGLCAHFVRRTTWDRVDGVPKEGSNLKALWVYVPLTETLSLSEESIVTVCPLGHVATNPTPTLPAMI